MTLGRCWAAPTEFPMTEIKLHANTVMATVNRFFRVLETGMAFMTSPF